MNENLKERNRRLAPALLKALQSRNMEAYFCETPEDAKRLALSLMPDASSITWGGSQTIEEIGLKAAVKSGDYTVYDRSEAKDDKEAMEILRKAYSADFYLTSSNAVTLDGTLINIDGMSNRVSAMAFGPGAVIMLVGMQKIVKNTDEGMSRIRNIASPMNALRLGIETPCAATGVCMDCKSPYCICCQILITRFSRFKGRTKVILINEELGY